MAERIKLGVAFAGGGVRGASHLGIIQAMHDHHIYPEIFTGTSAGSIVASLLASGHSPEEALDNFINVSSHLVDIAYGHILNGIFTKNYVEGFVAGDKLEQVLEEMFKDLHITDIYNRLGIVASDINKGRQVVFSSVPVFKSSIIDVDAICLVDAYKEYKLSEIVRASCSMPAIFVPKQIKDMKLVDGGITNNLPSDVAWALGADKVISIDLGYAGEVKTKGIIDIAHESINILMKRVVDGNRMDYGLYLNPQVFDVTALETSKIEECYHRGYIYGLNQIDNIAKMLES